MQEKADRRGAAPGGTMAWLSIEWWGNLPAHVSIHLPSN